MDHSWPPGGLKTDDWAKFGGGEPVGASESMQDDARLEVSTRSSLEHERGVGNASEASGKC